MRLEHLTAPAVAAYLADNSGIVLPIGATEQHGPDGLIGTDHLCAEVIARRFGAREGIVIAPTIAYGMSQFHLGFAGSVSLRPSTLVALVWDVIASLAATGFTRIYVLNGHGGNVAPIRCAIQEFYAARSLAGTPTPTHVHCRARSWWELPRVDRRRKALYAAGEGNHATPSEVAITMAALPDVIGPFERAAPPPAADTILHAGDNYFDAADYRARYPDGRVMSHSALATPADGEALIALAVDDLAQDFAAFCRSR